jgi:hypothetical protein
VNDTVEVKQTTQFHLDLKTLIGLLAGFISIAGVYFTLTAEISQLQIDNIRIQNSVGANWVRFQMTRSKTYGFNIYKEI